METTLTATILTVITASRTLGLRSTTDLPYFADLSTARLMGSLLTGSLLMGSPLTKSPPTGSPPIPGLVLLLSLPMSGLPSKSPTNRTRSFPALHPLLPPGPEKKNKTKNKRYASPTAFDLYSPSANGQQFLQDPWAFYHAARPLIKLGILATLISALIITLHGRSRIARSRMSWVERREARRAACQARRAAMRRRWIAFLDRLRPDDEYCYKEEEGRVEKTAMLSDEEPVDEKNEKGYEGFVDEKMYETEEEQEEGITSMSVSQEITSLQDACQLVSEMVAAKERRSA